MDKEKDGVNNQAGENKDPDFSENIFVNEDKQLDDLSKSEVNNEVSEHDDSEVSNKEELKEDNISEEEYISEVENLRNEINSEETLDVKEKSNEEYREEKLNKSGFIKKKKIIIGVCLCAVLILGIVANNVASKYEKIVYPGAKLYESNISKHDKNRLKEEIERYKV